MHARLTHLRIRTNRWLRMVLLLSLSPVLISACGGGSSGGTGDSNPTVEVSSAVMLNQGLDGFLETGLPVSSQLSVTPVDSRNSIVEYSIVNPTVGGSAVSVDSDGHVRWTPAVADFNTTELVLKVTLRQGAAQTLRLPVMVRMAAPMFEATLVPEQSVYSDADGVVSLRAETIDGSPLSGKLTVVRFSNHEGALSYRATAENPMVRAVFLAFPTAQAMAGGLQTQAAPASSPGLMAEQTAELGMQPFAQFLRTADSSCSAPTTDPFSYLQITTRGNNDVASNRAFLTQCKRSIFNAVTSYTLATQTAELQRAIQVDATCNGKSVKCSKEGNPIILIHGFNPWKEVGGGGSDGTWGNFSSRLIGPGEASAEHDVFEFRWMTYMRFEEAAGQLALLANRVAAITGKKPIIVAHSFGGIVSHLALSGQGVIWQNGGWAAPTDISGTVKRLVTLGSPVGGISSTLDASETMNGTTHSFVRGRDIGDITISNCRAITCVQAGAFDLSDVRQVYNGLTMWANLPSTASAVEAQAAFERAYRIGDKSYLTTGESIMRLKTKPHDVPSSIVVGLSTEEKVFSTANVASMGDGLISVAGQMYPGDVFGATSLESIAKGSPEKMFHNTGGNQREYFYLPGAAHTSIQGATVDWEILEAYLGSADVTYCIDRLYEWKGCKNSTFSKHHLWTMNSTPYSGSGQVGLLRETVGAIPNTVKPWSSSFKVVSPCPFPQICLQSNGAVAILPVTIELRRKDTGMRVSSARFYTDAAGKVEPDLTNFIDTTAVGFSRTDHQIRITLGDGVTYDIQNVIVDNLSADVVAVPDIVLLRKGTVGTGTVYGRVIDTGGRPVPNVQVTLRAGINLSVGDFAAVAPSTTARLVVTDSNGVFVVSSLRATEFTVRLLGSTISQRLQAGLIIPSGSSVSQDFVVSARSCPTGSTLQNGGCVGPTDNLQVFPIAFQGSSNGTSYYQTGLVVYIPRTASYDSATVTGAGISTSASLIDIGSGTTLQVQNVGGSQTGDVVQFSSSLAAGAVPAGSVYTVKLYKLGVLVDTKTATISTAVMATSQLTPSMFPALTLTALVDLCPNGASTTATYYTIPAAIPVSPQAQLDCTNTSVRAEVEAGNSAGGRFVTIYEIGSGSGYANITVSGAPTAGLVSLKSNGTIASGTDTLAYDTIEWTANNFSASLTAFATYDDPGMYTNGHAFGFVSGTFFNGVGNSPQSSLNWIPLSYLMPNGTPVWAIVIDESNNSRWGYVKLR